MKKFIAILFAALLAFTFAVSAMAQGSDDGAITVATKGDIRYLGSEITSGCVKYVAANGSDLYYYDMNGDKDMDICDLVALAYGQIDFDLSNTYDKSDAEAFRRLLLAKDSI